MIRLNGVFLTGACLLMLLGCGGEPASNPPEQTASASPEGRKRMLAAAPAGALDVIAAREKAPADGDVVVVGRIGGAPDPWVEGAAAFSIVDRSLTACNDIPGDSCPTPWDYCCEGDLGKSRVLVKFVGEDGQLLDEDARRLFGLTELQTVYVQGKAARDADGNLTVLASHLYVAPGEHHVPEHDHAPAAAGDADHHHEHDHDAGAVHDHDPDHPHDHDDAGARSAAPPAAEDHLNPAAGESVSETAPNSTP